MDVAALPNNLTPLPSANAVGNMADTLSVEAAQFGIAQDPDWFAALLAQQMDVDVKATLALEIPVAEDTPVADTALQLQQAALFMPAPVHIPNEIKVMPKVEVQTDAPLASLPGGDLADIKGQGVRQTVAANPAAFAVQEAGIERVPDKAFALKSAQVEVPQVNAAVTALPPSINLPVQANPVQNNSAQPSSNIPQAVGHSAWGGMLGERMVWMVGQQHQGVELHLNPPSLGPLEVRLSMSDGQANLSFATQHLPVKEAIESATSRLREMLGESGISLGSVSVNMGSFTQQQQADGQAGAHPGRFAWAEDTPATDFSSTLSASTRQLPRNGLVDIFA